MSDASYADGQSSRRHLEQVLVTHRRVDVEGAASDPAAAGHVRALDEAVVRSLTPTESVASLMPVLGTFVSRSSPAHRCRDAELGRIKREDYNDDGGTSSVRPSKGSNRHVVLAEEAIASGPG
jgi:integrase